MEAMLAMGALRLAVLLAASGPRPLMGARPHRWFLLIQNETGSVAQPVNNQREVCHWLRTLGPFIPPTAWVSVAWI